MKLTIVTDHRFFGYANEIFDDYVFDYVFFQNYLQIFDKVDVVCRVKKVEKFNNNWVKSSGEKVQFISLPDVHGIKWFLNVNSYVNKKSSLIFETDSFCFRLPSMAAWEIFRKNKSKQIPYIFESIGDPKDAMISSQDSLLKKVPSMIFGHILKNRKRKIVYHAQSGSYVSINHLQKKYPIKDGKITESISSIRLESRYILKEAKLIDLDQSINIIHIGSFIPLKNQKDLIQSFKIIKSFYPYAKLDFVGDGPSKISCEQLVENLDLKCSVTFHGQITGFDNIIKLLDDANFFILPSFNEGMPRALIEAMARGLICLGSNRGGISELLNHKYLFSVGDVEQISEKLIWLIKNCSNEDLEKISFENIQMAKEFEAEILRNRRYKLLKSLKEIL